MNATEFQELLNRKEDLEPELSMYLRKTQHGFQMLSHPLVTTLYSGANSLHNHTLQQQRERLTDHIERGEWEQAIYVYERPYRLDAFDMYWRNLPLAKAADMLLDIWCDTEFPFQRRTQWLRFFKRLAPYSTRMGTSRDTLFGYGPLDTGRSLTIYRGMLSKEGSKRCPYGMSWTLEVSRAQWFAQRFNAKGIVRQASVSRDGVFAYLIDRGEQEVVVDPAKLLDIHQHS